MYIRVPYIVEKFAIPKSTLFKAIHENRIRAIRVYRQYFVYWPDVRHHIIHQVIPNLLWWSTIKMPSPLPTGCVDAHTIITTLNLSRRQWKTHLKSLLAGKTRTDQFTWDEIDAAITTMRNQSIQQFRAIRREILAYDAAFNAIPSRQVVFRMTVDGEESYVLAEPPRTFDEAVPFPS